MNYNGKSFKPIINSENGETSEETIFHYLQNGNILSCEYSGGKIIKGYLIGLVDPEGNIDMRYQQVNREGNIMTGMCKSTPEIMDDGKIRIHEEWQWTSGDCSSGYSVLEEV